MRWDKILKGHSVVISFRLSIGTVPLHITLVYFKVTVFPGFQIAYLKGRTGPFGIRPLIHHNSCMNSLINKVERVL